MVEQESKYEGFRQKRDSLQLQALLEEREKINDEDWEKVYLNEYKIADKKRESGDYEQAFSWYAKAYITLINAEKRCEVSDKYHIRKASVSYSKILCLIALQRDPEQVMMEIYKYRLALQEMSNNIFETPMSPETEVNVFELLKKVKEYNRENFLNIDEKKLYDLWVFYFFLSNYSSILNTFLIRCTPHVDKTFTLSSITSQTGEMVKVCRERLSRDFIENNGVLTIIDNQAKWTEIYGDLSKGVSSLEIGDYTSSTVYFISHLRELDEIIDEYVNERESGKVSEKILDKDFEHAIELKADSAYADICLSEHNYDDAKENLIKLFKKSNKYPEEFKGVKIHIMIYLALGALRYEKIEDALDAYKMAESLLPDLRGESKEKDHLLRKWLSIIRSKIILLKYKDIIESGRKETKRRAFSTLQDAMALPKTDEYIKEYLDILSKAEQSLRSYKSPDSKVNYLIQEAEIYFGLGQVELEKAKLFGNELRFLENQDEIKDKEKIECFNKAGEYLRKAYNILRDLGYQDQSFYEAIEKAYKELLDYNYEISDMIPQQRNYILQFIKMDKVADNYQLQEWTDALYDLIRKQDLPNSESIEAAISIELEKVAKRFSPVISKVKIVSSNKNINEIENDLEDEFFIEAYKTNQHTKNSTVEFDFYDKGDEGGRIVTVININGDSQRVLFIESDIPLTEHRKNIFLQICSGLNTIFKVFDLHKKLNKTNSNTEISKYKRAILIEAYNIFINLLQRHEGTIIHSKRMAEWISNIVNEWNKDFPEYKIDPFTAKYAALLHDFCKVTSDPDLILNKATKLLPFEFNKVKNHGRELPHTFRRILGLKHFTELIAIDSVHHVPYGVDEGYPIDIIGTDMERIRKELLSYYNDLNDEEIKALNEKQHDSDSNAILAEFLKIFDHMEAITGDRAYRVPMLLEKLDGYLTSRSGKDFNGLLVTYVKDKIRQGLFNKSLARDGEDRFKLENFSVPNIYSWDVILECIRENKSELNTMCDLDFDILIKYLEKGENMGLNMSMEFLGARLHDGYEMQLREEFINTPVGKIMRIKNPPGFIKAIKQDADSKCKLYQEGFLDLVKKWLKENNHIPLAVTPENVLGRGLTDDKVAA